MTTITPSPPSTFPIDWTMADLQRHLGVTAERIWLFPPPGQAAVEDVERIHAQSRRLCELIDGVLVEKTVGYLESRLATELLGILWLFLRDRGLGVVLGSDGMLRLTGNQVRIPDVSYIARERFPGGRLPTETIPGLAPDLAVEVLSPSNTPREMDRKLHDYFQSGVRLVWYIDATARDARVFTAPDQFERIPLEGVLSGGNVLPGLEVSLADLFARAERID